MNEPLISILIPAYNVEQYLQECLDSVVNQTYSNIQIVIVDDGSTDSTPEICDTYKSKYPYVEVYHIPNGGVANARNQLLSKVKGDYVLFVDADDWIELEMVERLTHLALEYGLDITMCGQKVEDYIKPIESEMSLPLSLCAQWDRNTTLEKFIRHKDINGALWNKLIKADLLKGVKFNPKVSYGEDALAIWDILPNINRLGITSFPFYHHRINQSSISHGNFGPKMMSSHLVWQRISEDSKKHYPNLYPLAKANAAVADFWLLYFASLDNYPQDKNIAIYRNNVKRHLKGIKKMKLLSMPKYIVAYGLAYCYSATGFLIRLLSKTNLV